MMSITKGSKSQDGKARVFLTGGDKMDWALDADFRLTQQALTNVVQLTSLKECDVIHSVWWNGLTDIPLPLIDGKRIVCHVPGEPLRYLQIPEYSRAAKNIGCWVAQSRQAQAQLQSIGIDNVLIPYTVDTSVFRPILRDDPELSEFRKTWQIPEGRYLIGNFHRDTEGSNLGTPKLVKGPDLFAEIMHQLLQLSHPIHVVLAGPRRHWVRQRLSQLGVPFTFIGKFIGERDDYFDNLLSPATMNLLYSLIDVYVVSSRSEGGPRSVIEATAARCKIISTPVGLAPDALQSKCIFENPIEAVQLLAGDIERNKLADTLDANESIVHRNHRPATVKPLFADLYERWQEIEPCDSLVGASSNRSQQRNAQIAYARMRMAERIPPSGWVKRIWRAWVKPATRDLAQMLQRVRQRPSGDKPGLTLGLWHEFMAPPHGGGNQFMLALNKALLRRGLRVLPNMFLPAIDVYLLNSIHFDVQRYIKFGQKHRRPMVHRIDGPIHLIRGYDKEKDELCYSLNEQFASATILQSAWSYARICENGYRPVNPVIVHNAVDPDVFHARGRIAYSNQRKTRLISTSWSGNPRKGGAIYKWIEAHLDWESFEYTFVGRASESFDRINQLDPVPSEELADILRQHDIYITASQNDPCSNALIEALSCGLPALYLNDGGHPELVGFGGLSFDTVEEILPKLDILTANYQLFQNLITVPALDEVADKYLQVLKIAVRTEQERRADQRTGNG